MLVPGTISHFNELMNLTLNELRSRTLTLSGRSKLLPLNFPSQQKDGCSEVEQGALMTMASNENETLPVCETDVIERILQGDDIRNIPQYCHTTHRLYLNLKTARTIGWRPHFSILTGVDVAYHNFSAGHQRSTRSSRLN